MEINFTNILFILIIFQLLFLGFFLSTQKKGNRISNLLLGAFFLSICLNLLDVFLLISGVYFSYPVFAGWGSCMPLLFGPLLYLYTRSVVYKGFSLTLKKCSHFIPFTIFFLATEFYYISLPGDARSRLLNNLSSHHFNWPFAVGSSIIFIQFLFYIVYSLRLASQYKKAASQHFSDSKHTNVSWLYSTMVFFTVLMVCSTLNGLLASTSTAKYYLAAFNLIVLAMLVFVNRVLLKAMREPGFFSFEDEDSLQDKLTPHPETSAANNENEKTLQAILQYMQNNKPYMEAELTLHQLASLLSLKPKLLSNVINERLGQNFFDFINRYRIEEAKRLLTNPEDKKITVLEVLYQVGFNSKSSFNTLFKKYTSITPTEFKKKHAS